MNGSMRSSGTSSRTRTPRNGGRSGANVERRLAAARVFERQDRRSLCALACASRSCSYSALTLADEVVALASESSVLTTPTAREASSTCTVGVRVARRDLHGGVQLRRRRAADQQRHREAAALHLARHVHHLVERRRDQAGEADDVDLLGDGGVEDLSADTITPRSMTS